MPSDVRISGFKVIQEAADGQWTIKAEKATYEDDVLVVLDAVDARHVNSASQWVNVTGDSGRYRTDTKVLTLRGDVTVLTRSGFSFRAPEVVWDGSDSTIRSRGRIEAGGAGLTVTADRLNYDLEGRRAVVSGHVDTLWEIEELTRWRRERP